MPPHRLYELGDRRGISDASLLNLCNTEKIAFILHIFAQTFSISSSSMPSRSSSPLSDLSSADTESKKKVYISQNKNTPADKGNKKKKHKLICYSTSFPSYISSILTRTHLLMIHYDLTLNSLPVLTTPTFCFVLNLVTRPFPTPDHVSSINYYQPGRGKANTCHSEKGSRTIFLQNAILGKIG